MSLRPVDLGVFREDGATITRGLADGDWIVAAGVNKLAEGQVVRPYDAPGLAPAASAARRSATQMAGEPDSAKLR